MNKIKKNDIFDKVLTNVKKKPKNFITLFF